MTDSGNQDNKRRSVRQRTFKGAKIVFGSGQFSYTCIVKNLSEIGAQLALESTELVPNRFDLVFDDNSLRRSCTVAWRSATKLGVTFNP